MERYERLGSLETVGAPPPMNHPGSPLQDPAVVGAVDDDFLNHILFGAWSAGLLCLDLSDEDSPIALPIAIDTGLLALLAGADAYAHLFEETQPVELTTDPREPPVAKLDQDHDLTVVIDPLGLQFVTEVEGRKARVLNIDLAGDLGVDLAYNGSNGFLNLDVDTEGVNVTPTVSYNEFAPDTSARIEDSTVTLVDTVLTAALAGLDADVGLAVPGIFGLGLTAAEVAPAGEALDHLGMYGTLGPVDFPASGCTEGGGCDTSSCSAGCSTSTLPGGLAFFLFPVLVAVLRRQPH